VNAAAADPVVLAAAVITPRGRGAVATIRLCGDAALLDRAAVPIFQAANGRGLSQQEAGRIAYGRWGRDTVEDVVVCRIDDSTWEVHCHGGERAVERVLRDCRHLGAAIVDAHRLAAATRDVLETELHEALRRATTWRAAEFLLSQADGRLQGAYRSLSHVDWTAEGRRFAKESLARLLRWSNFGVHLTQPWRIVLTGRPNVGKSSLINALLGYQRSIVFDEPGTTRDVLTAETAFEGWPVQLIDTAGMRIAEESLEAEGIARARRQLVDADLVLRLVDISQPAEEEASQPAGSPGDSPPAMVVAHKCDLADRWGSALPADALKVSSVTGEGLETLQREMIRRLIPEVPALEEPVPVTPRQGACLEEAFAAVSSGDEFRYRDALRALVTGAAVGR
jgi:tRNA modification GTPase